MLSVDREICSNDLEKRVRNLEGEVRELRALLERQLTSQDLKKNFSDLRFIESIKENLANGFADSQESLRAEMELAIAPIKNRLSDLDLSQKKVQRKQSEAVASTFSEVKQLLKQEFSQISRHFVTKEEVKDLVLSPKKEPDSRSLSKLVDNLMEEQRRFNEFFCSEFVFCRLTWNRPRQRNGRVIFDSQEANTLTQNFVWKEDALTVAVGGFYELKIAASGNLSSLTVVEGNEVVMSKAVDPGENIGESKIVFLRNGAKFFVVIESAGASQGIFEVKRL